MTDANAPKLPEDLTLLEREMLWLLALANSPLTRTNWGNLGAHCAEDMPSGKEGRESMIASLSEKFEALELLNRDYLEARTPRYALESTFIRPALQDAAEQGALPIFQAHVQAHAPGWSQSYYGSNDYHAVLSDLRVAFVLRDKQALDKLLDSPDLRYAHQDGQSQLLIEALGPEPIPEELHMLPSKELKRCAGHAIAIALRQLRPLSSPFHEALVAGTPHNRLELARYLILRGEFEAARALPKLAKGGLEIIEILIAFFSGERVQALELADNQVAQMKRKYKALRSLEGIVHGLCRAEGGGLQGRHWVNLGATLHLSHSRKTDFPAAYASLEAVHQAAGQLGDGQKPHALNYLLYPRDDTWVEIWTQGLAALWLDNEESLKRLRGEVEAWAQVAENGGFKALAPHLRQVVEGFNRQPVDAHSLVRAFRIRPRWELALEVLETLEQKDIPETAAKAPTQQWLSWQLVISEEGHWITPKLRTPRSRKGKDISLKKLSTGQFDFVSNADRRVLAHIIDDDEWGYSRSGRKALAPRAIVELVDHPHVSDADGLPLQVKGAEPSLHASTIKGETVMTIHPPELCARELVVEQASTREVLVYRRSADLQAILSAFRGASLIIPKEGKERVSKVLGLLAGKIRINATGAVAIEGEKIGADSRPRALLDWDGSMLSIYLRVAPLGMEGPMLEAGAGHRTLAAVVDQKPLQTERKLREEKTRVEKVLLACPTLASLTEEGRQAVAPDHYLALDVLAELSKFIETEGDDSLTLAWPQGRTLKTPKIAEVADLSVRVGMPNDWLSLEVELKVSDDLVLSYRELLGLRQAKERYVDLGEKGFLRLTRDLESRLDTLEGLDAGGRSKQKLKLSLLTLPLVEGLFEEKGSLSLDKKSSAHLTKLKKAQSLRAPVPKTLGTELRGYQLEGYRWMARLAAAELGACLADDMGLGKTVQTLAILLRRAKSGPALVVAPTTVAANWVQEAYRFAPTLRCRLLSELDDRSKSIEAMGSQDVLVASYSLMTLESESLQDKVFSTVVFDEAHYLKNANTQRSKAAFGLRSSFRIALTGTPVENHLGELWSLMQATVPGLLGSARHFTTRFAKPIAEENQERAAQLKSLIDPFLLRRTKGQVLQELPERTEITLRITPTADERAFYEALRQRAEENLHALKQSQGKGNQRLEILAEIGRLRQAAVDPRLLDPEFGPPGAKIDALIEKLVALSEEGHRTLVFTQFLGSMEQIRRRLEEAKIDYLSLDGSTPAKKRAQMIDEFQSGDADVFLMSLKAGGIGVNLTGADYVIHVDPWWNPAVEEQATGRAHRIGQRRPVTIYRLITEGTIEEKILTLHQQKRDLADTLLSGMDQARKLDLKELRALLAG